MQYWLRNDTFFLQEGTALTHIGHYNNIVHNYWLGEASTLMARTVLGSLIATPYRGHRIH